MGKPVEITRLEFSARELRELAASTQDGAVVRRLLAIALILDGYSRTEAAQLNGMDRQTLRDWAHRYNDEAVAGLRCRVSPGRPGALNGEQMEELRSMVLEGPDPERDTVIRWRCADPRDVIAARWSVNLHERSVGRLLHRLGMTRLQPRPCHPQLRRLLTKLPPLGNRGLAGFRGRQADRDLVPEPALGLDPRDEARIGQKGSLEYIWAPVGSRPLMVRDNRHDSAYLFGAICHARKLSAAIIMPSANAKAISEHLKEISTQFAPGAHAVVVCDGAGWHQSGGRFRVPANITLLPLRPYAPELNPMENIWDYRRGNKLSKRVWNSYQEIVAACKDAWLFLVDDLKRIDTIAHRACAWVNFRVGWYNIVFATGTAQSEVRMISHVHRSGPEPELTPRHSAAASSATG